MENYLNKIGLLALAGMIGASFEVCPGQDSAHVLTQRLDSAMAQFEGLSSDVREKIQDRLADFGISRQDVDAFMAEKGVQARKDAVRARVKERIRLLQKKYNNSRANRLLRG